MLLCAFLLSLPLWECGLKFAVMQQESGGNGVTPLVGVWIEMPFCQLLLSSTPNSCYTKTKHFNRKKVAAMGFFKKKEKAAPSGDFDRENEKPIIKASICNGEQIAGFKNIHTGKMREIMLIKTSADLEYFKTMYGIETEIEKEY